MSALDNAIREALHGGRLRGLTLWPDPDRGWQGNARWNGTEGWTVHMDHDPVAALIGALQGTPNVSPSNPVGPAQRPSPTADVSPVPPPTSTSGVFD